jgi:hypothetical protein
MKSQTVLKRENKFLDLFKNLYRSFSGVSDVKDVELNKELQSALEAADRYADTQDSLLGTSSAEIDNTRRVTTSSVGTSIHRTTPNRLRDMEISR